MTVRFVLSDYVDRAMAEALYDKLEDGTFAGRIPPCKGVVAFGATLRECEDELRSTLEEWMVLGLKLKHRLPVIAGIDLNEEPEREPVGALQPPGLRCPVCCDAHTTNYTRAKVKPTDSAGASRRFSTYSESGSPLKPSFPHVSSGNPEAL